MHLTCAERSPSWLAPFFAGFLLLAQAGCLEPEANPDLNQPNPVPSASAEEVYAWNLQDRADLCADPAVCLPNYDLLPPEWLMDQPLLLGNQTECVPDMNPFATNTFDVAQPQSPLDGHSVLLSAEDFFFLAWTSVQLGIHPHFLLGIMLAESGGNCAAVSSSGAQGCFQITDYWGRLQLAQSYGPWTDHWHWVSRNHAYYPSSWFIDPALYFEDPAAPNVYRMTPDYSPQAAVERGHSSVMNFPFGVWGAGLYFHWQAYFAYHLRAGDAERYLEVFESFDGKATWQAATYNAGIGATSQAVRAHGANFLQALPPETRAYAPRVVDYCREMASASEGAYFDPQVTWEDFDGWIWEWLRALYPPGAESAWDALKEPFRQTFFPNGEALSLRANVKAMIYWLAVNEPALAPPYPDLM